MPINVEETHSTCQSNDYHVHAKLNAYVFNEILNPNLNYIKKIPSNFIQLNRCKLICIGSYNVHCILEEYYTI